MRTSLSGLLFHRPPRALEAGKPSIDRGQEREHLRLLGLDYLLLGSDFADHDHERDHGRDDREERRGISLRGSTVHRARVTGTAGGGSSLRIAQEAARFARPPAAASKPEAGFEPATSRLQGACSGQLSYSGRQQMVSRRAGEACLAPTVSTVFVGAGHARPARVTGTALAVPPCESGERRPDSPGRSRGLRGYERTWRDCWCWTTLRFTRWRALSIVFVSQPSSSAISSYESPSM
jgi:hypothetical protein